MQPLLRWIIRPNLMISITVKKVTGIFWHITVGILGIFVWHALDRPTYHVHILVKQPFVQIWMTLEIG